jgi:hypothetical protein
VSASKSRSIKLRTDIAPGHPRLALARLQTLDDGLCRILLERAFSDDIDSIDLEPLSLVCRLAAAVPAPDFNTVRRHGGVLARAATLAHPRVIPEAPHPATVVRVPGPDIHGGERESEATDSTRRSRWLPWAELRKCSFDIPTRT